MAVQLILSQKGPLPITTTFNSIGDMSVFLEVNGSVWSKTPDQMIGIGIQVDGQSVGTAQIFSNGASTHRAVVPAFIQLQLAYGQHKLTLTANNAVSDLNDLYTAVIHY